ncbi:MAG TPA: DUF1835 domain-containing protein [Blastocatellia bacterium]|nr:DUF1835 domain-containing protein [Blastocatellia bacterium]
MLHITNGDFAADLIKDAVFTGQILAWRDVLYEGPVPAGLELQQLSNVRVDFIVDQGWGKRYEVKASFDERDSTLVRFREHDEIVLWFEHDLYDQLQLIQLLGWFFGRERGATKLSLICIGEYPGIHPFHGLGQLTVDQMASLFPVRHTVSYKELKTGFLAWQAFTSADPQEIEKLLATNLNALPFLRSALLRHLQQFPATTNGLARTEQQILAGVAAGQQNPREIFQYDQAQENHVFMGDWTLWSYVKRLCERRTPLLKVNTEKPFFLPMEEPSSEFWEQKLSLTDAGQAVLAGEADNIQLNGIDRWLGGVHLQGDDAAWRWDGVRLIARA